MNFNSNFEGGFPFLTLTAVLAAFRVNRHYACYAWLTNKIGCDIYWLLVLIVGSRLRLVFSHTTTKTIPGLGWVRSSCWACDFRKADYFFVRIYNTGTSFRHLFH